MIHYDDASILGDVLCCSDDFPFEGVCDLAREGDHWVTQRAEVLLQCQPSKLGDLRQRGCQVPAARIQDEVLNSSALELFGKVGKFLQAVLGADHQGALGLLCHSSHRFPVVTRCSKEHRLVPAFVSQCGLERISTIRHQNKRKIGLGPHGFYHAGKSVNIA